MDSHCKVCTEEPLHNSQPVLSIIMLLLWLFSVRICARNKLQELDEQEDERTDNNRHLKELNIRTINRQGVAETEPRRTCLLSNNTLSMVMMLLLLRKERNAFILKSTVLTQKNHEGAGEFPLHCKTIECDAQKDIEEKKRMTNQSMCKHRWTGDIGHFLFCAGLSRTIS